MKQFSYGEFVERHKPRLPEHDFRFAPYSRVEVRCVPVESGSDRFAVVYVQMGSDDFRVLAAGVPVDAVEQAHVSAYHSVGSAIKDLSEEDVLESFRFHLSEELYG